jgi:soluble lytic murein transglycosylase-like protein
LRLAIASALMLLGGGLAAAQSPGAGGTESVHEALCRLIESSARAEKLPVEFFTRLIWTESAFRTGAVSPAGARGVAQFMPGTAAERGLADPFDPEQAIPKSADLLAEHRRRFGNLGLAAAAYNGGPGRVQNWLDDKGGLPDETRNYVARSPVAPRRTGAR